MNKNNNYIWIFGENVGQTANNNSFYFWKHILKNNDSIEKYMVLEKNKKNIEVYKNLDKNEKKFVVWRNSIKHFMLFRKADMYYVSLSYRDIRPEKFWFKKFDYKIKKPLIYLQHGTLGIKKISYGGRTYNNNLFRFLYYNKQIENQLIEENGFRKYQLYYGEFHPRYKELVKRNNSQQNDGKNSEKNVILWFLTWREYNANSIDNKIFIRTINKVLKNKTLNEYLSKNDIKLRLCLHQLYKIQKEDFIRDVDNSNIEIVYANSTDIMDEIVNSKLLITDYSSLGFDYTLLNKPVIMFQPDLESYMKGRDFYCDLEELKQNNVESSKELIDIIVNKKYGINNFFRSRISDDIDYTYLEKGKHIDKMYEYFKEIQENKITFIGYNFHGVGGTVSATRALAEGLLEQGKMVELLSLKVTGKPRKMPYALNTQYIYHSRSKRFIVERIRRKLYNRKSNYKYFIYDENRTYIKPFAGHDLEKILSNIKSNTVISTRESMHLFLDDAKSEKIKNKIYFFHCSADVVEKIFPGVMNKIKERNLKKTVFVTEKNRQQYIEKLNYTNYEKYLIIGNTLENDNVIDIEDIEAIEEKEKYRGIYLLRISKDRISDLNNLIEFGKYLRDNNIKNIVIDIYGDGDYVDEFIDILIDNELLEYIHYNGKTTEPTECIRQHDALIDFSENHSFGMTYIEGILNGKKVFCIKNTGSLEVMGDIENTFIESNQDLVNKINSLPNITKEELQENYRKIEEKFSRKKVSEKFLKYIK